MLDGVMYVTNARATVAIDVGTGKQIWKTPVDWLPETPRIVCCGVSNKDAAILNGKLYRTTLDAHVIALDMKTGKEIWNQKAAEWKEGYPCRMIDEKDPRRKRFYHGGDDGLKVGEHILPPKDTGKNIMFGRNPLWRKDQVYLTKNIADAWCFAARSNNPRVYEVTPLGELEDDPDLPTKGISFQCPKAKIIALYDEPPGIIDYCRELMRKMSARKP